MASCVLCVSLGENGSKLRFTTKNEAQSHAIQHFVQMKRLDLDSCITSKQVCEQCFPNRMVHPLVKRKKRVKREGRQQLLQLCHASFDGRISKDSPRVTCRICRTSLNFYDVTTGWSDFRVPIEHASLHLGIDLFECRKCDSGFGSKSAVCCHLRKTHCLRALRECYTDKCHEFIDEISASIKECFCEGHVSGHGLTLNSKARTIRLNDETHVRCKMKGSKLAAERQVLCYQLIRQLVGKDQRIQCRLCSMSISVKKGSGIQGDGAMEHALVHLKKPLFRCKVCSNVLHSRSVLKVHLKLTHALPLSKNYECLTDGFHDEIMSMLRKCYKVESGE